STTTRARLRAGSPRRRAASTRRRGPARAPSAPPARRRAEPMLPAAAGCGAPTARHRGKAARRRRGQQSPSRGPAPCRARGGRARSRSAARRPQSLDARQAGVAPEAPPLLERGVHWLPGTPLDNGYAESPIARPKRLTAEEPDTPGELVEAAAARRCERHRRDLDHRQVEPAGAEVEQRPDRPLVEQRRKGENKR